MAAAASLVVRVSAQVAEFQKSFNDINRTTKQFTEDFEGMATRAATVGAFLGTIAANIASSMARAFGQGIADAVRLSSEFSNAFIGLGSVSRAFGTDADAAKDAAKRLSSDGLLPLKDSATGLKNLLATGFSLDQSVKLMNAFKDSAAFGRQGALSFGDAIRSATEGVKNGNSILVDNAGITKNLSNILKEAGLSAQDLSRASSDAGVRQALFNGILKESAAFAGDATRLTQTYSGTLTAMRTQWNNLLATWGDAITQNRVVQEALAFTGEAFGRLAGFLGDSDRGFKIVSDAVIGFVNVLAAGVRGINFLQQAFNAMDTAIVSTVKFFADGAKVIADTALSIATLASKLPGSTFALSVFKEELQSAAFVSVKAGEAATNLGARLDENATRSKTWGAALGGFAGSLDDLAKRLENSRGKFVEFGNSGGLVGGALGVAGAAAGEFAKKLEALDDTIKGVKVLQQAKLWAEALKRPAIAAKVLANDALRGDMVKALDAVEKHFGSLKNVGLDALEGLRGQAKAVQMALVPLATIPMRFVFSGGGIGSGGGLGVVDDFIPQIPRSSLMSAIVDPLKSVFAGIDASSIGALSAIARVNAGTQKAIEAGGKSLWDGYLSSGMDQALDGLERVTKGVTQALVSLARTGLNAFAQMSESAKNFGKSVVQSTASVIDMGVAVFNLVRQAVNFLERDNKTSAITGPFYEAAGGARQLAADARLAGISLDRLYNTDSASSFRAEADRVTKAIADQKRQLDAYGLSWRDFNAVIAQDYGDNIARTLIKDFKALVQSGANPERVIEGMSGAINQLIVDSVRAGTRIPAAMRPIIEAMIRAGKVTEEAARAMLGLAADTMPSLADIKEAADRYGLTLDQLGQKVQQLRITEEAKQIVKDFKLLELAGADVVTVAVAMKDKIQDIITTALRTGLEVPEAMRPILQILVDMGLLTDENGVKLENLDRITFGKDLVGAIELLIEKLDELIDWYSAVGTAAEDAWRRAKPPSGVFTGTTAIPRSGTSAPTPDYTGGTGGQRVDPASIDGTSSIPDSGTTTTIIELDGQTIAEVSAPYIPGAARRYVGA